MRILLPLAVLAALLACGLYLVFSDSHPAVGTPAVTEDATAQAARKPVIETFGAAVETPQAAILDGASPAGSETRAALLAAGTAPPAGMAWLEVAVDRVVQEVRVAESAAGQAYAVPLPVPLVAGERRALEIQVPCRHPIRGVVTGTGGAPVKGATVRAYRSPRYWIKAADAPDETMRTDARGRFLVVSMEKEFTLDAEAPGQVANARIEPDDGEYGRPTGIPGVNATYRTERAARSDDKGRFEITGMVAEATRMQVEHPDYLTQMVAVEAGQTEIVVRLDAGFVVLGRLRRSNGAPAAGARVTLEDFGELGKSTTTAEDGSFRFSGVHESSDAFLAAHAKGDAPALLRPLAVHPGMPLIELQLAPGLPLAGRVVDSEGRGVPGAHVDVFGDRDLSAPNTTYSYQPTLEGQFDLSSTATGPDDAFRLVDLNPGSYSIVVRDRLSGLPVASFTVVPMKYEGDGGSGNHHDFETADGSFLIRGLGPGRYGLDVFARGYANWDGPVADYTGGARHFEVDMLPTRVLKVRVVDAAGRPEPFVNVRPMVDGRSYMVETGPGSRSGSASGGPDGVVTLVGLPAGPVTLELRDAGTNPMHSVEMNLRFELPEVQDVQVPWETRR
ncbi:MAG TPA: carboxypeptidase-like regulatory domain-containing protein [Planctomycetota bacterium]